MASLKRKPKNLFLDPVAVARGERYSRLHGTSLSRLVDDFLLALQLKDFEDAVQVAACLRAGADFLVTRNPRDFAGAPVELRSAGEIAAMLGNT